MSNGKAVTKKSLVDEVIKLKRENVKSYGQQRQRVSSGAYIGTSGQKGGSDSNDISTAYLKTAGDTMIGPLAFYPKTSTLSSGIMDASKSTGAYSSRIYVIGQGSSADDLEVILGASHAGQILFFQPIIANITLQSYLKTTTAWSSGTSYNIGDVVLYLSQRYTCYVAHTSSGSITPTDATKWHRNNIRLTGADDRVVTTDEIVMLQYDTTDGVWTLVSGGSVSTGAGLGDANVWTNVNTFQNTVNMYGTVNLGDSTADRVNFIAQVGTDINMSTYDVVNLDRLKFATTQGAGTALGTSDTGIEAQYSGGSSAGIKFQVPTNNIYQFFSGSTEKINIGASAITLLDDVIAATTFTVNGETTLGNSSSDDINIVGNIDTDISIAASKKIRAYSTTEIGYYVKNATSAVGSEGTVQIPTKNTGVGNAATANSDFGSEIGCIGLYTLGNPTLVIKYSSTAWQGVIFGSSGNPTVFQF